MLLDQSSVGKNYKQTDIDILNVSIEISIKAEIQPQVPIQTQPRDEGSFSTRMQDTAAVGIVQWVVPTRPRCNITKNPSNKRNSSREPNGYMANNGFPSSDTDARSFTSNDSITPDTIRIVLPDPTLLRTISAFVEGHLEELKEHQKSINKARLNSATQTGSTIRTQLDCDTTVAGNRPDVTKLKVRDEQTKAIETIKQLTNYFRELTYLIKQCDAQKDRVDEETINKLSDLRSEITQAVNDFVLANSDIDLPILEFDDSEYDYCVGAREAPLDRSTPQPVYSVNHPSGIVVVDELVALDNSCDPESPARNNQQLVTTIDDQSIVLEKRRREIQKIERDTEELKRLFTDFYSLVKAQGEQVDSIENNIVIATHRISEGHRNMNKAMKSLTVIMPVTGCIAGALVGGPLGLALGGKMGGITVGCVTSLVGLMSSYSAHRCMVAKRIKND